jgi:DNA-binding transcriptional LysR family regulator
MKQPPPLYALRAFEMAARLGSFTRAADHLCLSQSAVSHHVKNLENHLECKLFQRNGKILSLTERGEQLSSDLRDAFMLIEKACYKNLGEASGIKIKTPTSLTARWLLSITHSYNTKSSRNPIQISSHWMEPDEVDFHSEPFDGAILLSNGDFPDHVVSTKLFDEWLVPICSSDFLDVHAESFTSVHHLPLLHPSLDKRDWKKWLYKTGYKNNFNVEEGMKFDTLDQGITAAYQGLGISIADLSMIKNDLESHRLHIPLPYAVHSGMGYFFVRPKHSARQELLEDFVFFLSQHSPNHDVPGLTYIK